MTWAEAVNLTGVLSADTTSMVCSAALGWDSPRSRDWLVLADLYDAFARANFKSPKPYPRPFSSVETRRFGSTRLDRSEVVALLNKHGHNIVDG